MQEPQFENLEFDDLEAEIRVSEICFDSAATTVACRESLFCALPLWLITDQQASDVRRAVRMQQKHEPFETRIVVTGRY